MPRPINGVRGFPGFPEPEKRMSILSLQSIIQKYGARYGINPKAVLKDPANGSGKGAANAAGGVKAKDHGQPDAAAAKIPPADSVHLSAAAMDFLSSHTGPLGKFEMPNVLDAFLGAMNGTDQSGSGSDTGNSLLDYLSGSGTANQGDTGMGANDPGNPFAAGKGAPKSLLDFL